MQLKEGWAFALEYGIFEDKRVFGSCYILPLLHLPPAPPASLPALFLHFYVCACSVGARVSPKITLRYPHNQTTNDNIIAQAFQNGTQKKGVVATLTCNNPLIDPCGFCISPPLSPLFSQLSHIHHPPTHTPPVQREPPSLGGDQELPVGGALSRSPGSVELTQSC